jgi:hypothetical protein
LPEAPTTNASDTDEDSTESSGEQEPEKQGNCKSSLPAVSVSLMLAVCAVAWVVTKKILR